LKFSNALDAGLKYAFKQIEEYKKFKEIMLGVRNYLLED